LRQTLPEAATEEDNRADRQQNQHRTPITTGRIPPPLVVGRSATVSRGAGLMATMSPPEAPLVA
jgi:hypothetical protein